MIQFNVLGAIDLRRADGGQMDELLRQPKRLALLAYLAIPLPGTWHRRDILLGVFWPGLDTEHARTSLRNALYVLRRALGDGVLQNRGDEEVSVDPGALQTDLAALRVALRAGRKEEALTRYRGDLLPGLYPSDSDGFLPWLDAERSRLRFEMAKAGSEWAMSLERDGRIGDALAATRRVLEINPDDETVVRRIMALHGAMGDRGGGLAVFEEYARRIAQDFDAHPAPETTALADSMRGSNVTTRSTSPHRGGSSAAEAAEPGVHSRADQSEPRLQQQTAAAPRARSLFRNASIAAVACVAAAVVVGLEWDVPGRNRPDAIGKSNPLTSDVGFQIQPSIAPNGRLAAYVKGTSFDRMRILVQRVGGGPSWALTGDSNSVELVPRWSADNDQVLFLARNSAWVSPAIGGVPRLVAAGDAGDGSVRSAAWSPGGDSVAVVRNDSLLIKALDGPGSRFVGRGSQLHSCDWSPTGAWIACVSGNWISMVPGTLFGNRAPSAIVLFPTTGGRAIPVTDSEKEYRNPSWSPDGKFLWVLSNRDGPEGEVYAIHIGHDGKREGDLFKVGLKAESFSMVNGRIAYSVSSRFANVWSVPIPSNGDRLPVTMDHAEPITSGNQIIEIVRVSHDRKWLVYDSNLRGNSDIYRVPLAGDHGNPERLTDDAREEFAGDLSPDDRVLAYHIWQAGKRRLVTRRLEDGVIEDVLSAPGDEGTPRWSPDGRALIAWSHDTETGSIVVVRRAEKGGWSPPAWQLKGAQLPVWAPDGGSLAYVTLSGSVESIAADSGSRRVFYAPRPGTDDPIATYLDWESGRSGLWFLGHSPEGRSGIWELSLPRGRPRLIVDFHNTMGRMNGPTFTSDGRRFYLTLDERLANIQLAELIAR